MGYLDSIVTVFMIAALGLMLTLGIRRWFKYYLNSTPAILNLPEGS